ncbi:hypothetical protein KOPIIPEJ_03956 [Aeromonas dhakensis]
MLLHYHDPAGWPVIREALLEMDKGHLIGNGPDCLVPPEGRGEAKAERSRSKGLKPALTRHSPMSQQRGEHQRGNGAGNKPTGGKPVGSQLQKGAANGKPAAQGEGKSAGKGKPAGKPATRAKRRPALALPSRVPNPQPKGVVPSDQRGKCF